MAPIALYPDALLANLLAAATYPLEVVEADRWVKANKNLKGEALKAEVDKKGWDDSVKALTATSSVLDMMNDKLDWSKELGDAMLAQQADVMDAIQRLRDRARTNNKLSSNKQQTVTVKQQEGKQAIVIQQTDPNAVYVPYYDPAVVYGAWPYAAYPPYYFGYPGYIAAGVVAAGIAFGTAWAIGRWGNYWGGGCNWGNRNVYVNHRTTNVWQHNSYTVRVFAITTLTLQIASAITLTVPASLTAWISAARAASRCLILATAPVLATAPPISVIVVAIAAARSPIEPATAAAATEPTRQTVAATAETPATVPMREIAPLRQTGLEAAASTCHRAARPELHRRAAGLALPAREAAASVVVAASAVVAEADSAAAAEAVVEAVVAVAPTSS